VNYFRTTGHPCRIKREGSARRLINFFPVGMSRSLGIFFPISSLTSPLKLDTPLFLSVWFFQPPIDFYFKRHLDPFCVSIFNHSSQVFEQPFAARSLYEVEACFNCRITADSLKGVLRRGDCSSSLPLVRWDRQWRALGTSYLNNPLCSPSAPFFCSSILLPPHRHRLLNL